MDIFSPFHLLIVLLLVVLIFGTKKLGGIGADLGKAIRGFKKELNATDGDDKAKVTTTEKLQADPAPAAAASEAPKQESAGTTQSK